MLQCRQPPAAPANFKGYLLLPKGNVAHDGSLAFNPRLLCRPSRLNAQMNTFGTDVKSIHALLRLSIGLSPQAVLRTIALGFLEQPFAERLNGWAGLLAGGTDQPVPGFDIDDPLVGLD